MQGQAHRQTLSVQNGLTRETLARLPISCAKLLQKEQRRQERGGRVVNQTLPLPTKGCSAQFQGNVCYHSARTLSCDNPPLLVSSAAAAGAITWIFFQCQAQHTAQRLTATQPVILALPVALSTLLKVIFLAWPSLIMHGPPPVAPGNFKGSWIY